MELKEVQRIAAQRRKNYMHGFDITPNPHWDVMKLMEEAGEVMGAYLRYIGEARMKGKTSAEVRQDLEDEMADLLGMLACLANEANVDLAKVFQKKWKDE